MTDPITTKLKSLSPTYKLHNAQQHAIREAEHPEEIAASIDRKVAAAKELADRHWGSGVAEIDDLLSAITFYSAGTFNPKVAPVGFLLGGLSKERIFELGKRASNDVISVLYRGFLGRWPDAPGRAHYQRQIDEGRPMWEIVREIELSEEALSLKR